MLIFDVDLVNLWHVNPKIGFERLWKSTLGCPIDFNVIQISDFNIGSMANTDLRAKHWVYGEAYSKQIQI